MVGTPSINAKVQWSFISLSTLWGSRHLETNHRIVESQNRGMVRIGRDLKDHLVSNPLP